MKKILLTSAAVLAISGSAFAEMDQFYLRADANVAKFAELKSDGDKYKTKFNNFGLDFGVGTNLMDNMRAELVYNHVFATKAKHTEGTFTAKMKPQASALMLRGLVDIADMGMGKPYFGAGFGWAKAGAKETNSNNGSFKAKARNNFAYSVHAGFGFDVADGVKADLGYSYRDYGKTRDFKDGSTSLKNTAVSLRSHNLSAGVRFDI